MNLLKSIETRQIKRKADLFILKGMKQNNNFVSFPLIHRKFNQTYLSEF